MKVIAKITVEGKSKHLKSEFILRQTVGGEYEFGWKMNDGCRMQPVDRFKSLQVAVYKANCYLSEFSSRYRINLSSIQKELLSKTL